MWLYVYTTNGCDMVRGVGRGSGKGEWEGGVFELILVVMKWRRT